MPLKRQSRPETNLESRYKALTVGGEIQAPPAELAQAASKRTYHWSVNRDVKQEAEQP